MSLTRLRYFAKVARLGSIREAADALHVAPSAVSRQIAKLEEQLGVELLEPNGRGIRLTAAGRILSGHASQMLGSLELARSEIDDLVGLRRGHVVVWSAEGSVNDLLMPTIEQFRRNYPAVTLELVIAGTDRIVRAVLDDDADIGVAFNPPEEPALLEFGKLTSPMMVVGHPRHPAMRLRSLSLAELAKHPLALPDASFGLRHLVDSAARAAGVRLRPVVETNSIEALRAFARLGIGLTLTQRTAVAGDLRRRLLAVVPLDASRTLRDGKTAILVRKERRLPVAAMQFAIQIAQTAKQLEA